jgi:hypothetical protein
LFADDIQRPFVDSEPKENRVPHLVVTGPFGEFYLANEIRDEPCGRVLVLYFLVEGFRVGV